jgi:hypothetical protein
MTATDGRGRTGDTGPDLTLPPDSATLRHGMTHLPYVLKPKPARPCLEAVA